MEEEKQAPLESPPPTFPQVPKPQPIMVHKSSNAPLVGAIVFLALVIAFAAVFLGMKKNNVSGSQSIQPTTAISPTSAAIPFPSPTAAAIILQNFTSQKLKDISFPAYTISFPEMWVKTAKHIDITDSLTLTKGEYSIKIYQAPMGGGQCVFEGSMPEGPSQDFRKSKFEDIIVGEITLRRVEQTNGFTFCSNSTSDKASFGSPTSFGAITYTTPANPDTAILTEMDNIIKSLK